MRVVSPPKRKSSQNKSNEIQNDTSFKVQTKWKMGNAWGGSKEDVHFLE
jgi:hypothetical protein